MSKARLLAFPLSLALAVAGASAVMAQDESESEMSDVPEYTTEAGQFVYAWLRTWMEASGEVADETFDELDAWYEGLDEADLDDVAEAHLASEGISALQQEIGDGDMFDLDDEDDDSDDDSE